MTKHHNLLRFVSLIIFSLAFTAFAYAVAPQRTFVSAQTGSDANTVNNCSLLQPCRNFNAAIGVVNAGGEVVALNSGGYGVTTITKAVTLTSPSGVYAAITALTAGSSAITVSAAGTDTVVLRGLTLTGLGGDNGIDVSSVGNLHVEGCVISGFAFIGINVVLTADGSHVFIKDTIVRNNTGGIQIETTTGTVSGQIDNCRSERNVDFGYLACDNSRVTINRSVASGNGGFGFEAFNPGAGLSELNCEECVSTNNGYGFVVDPASGGTATIRVSHSTATNNSSVGFFQDTTGGTAVFESLGNNLVRGNGSDTSGTITIITGN
jgi:hypothetical protein